MHSENEGSHPELNRITEINIYYPEQAKAKTDADAPHPKDGDRDGETNSPDSNADQNTHNKNTVIPINFHTGPDPGPCQKDLEIESRKVRLALPESDANLCISVMPGTNHLGELSISVQYEGAKRDDEETQRKLRNVCMSGQNDLAETMATWLTELFDDAPVPWKFAIDAEPCPEAEEEFRILKIVQALEHQVLDERRATHERDRGPDIDRDRGREIDR